MKTFKRVLFILVALIVLIILTGFILFNHISKRAVPDYNRDIAIVGLFEPVEVYRDSFAVPHVFAKNEHDLYMVTGYLLAQDRLWQMDMLRHVTEGRLSEIFGAEYVETDLLLRALRFAKKSEQMYQDSDSAKRMILNAFSDGVNQFIETNNKHLPPEFAILRYKPEKWEPRHTLNMVSYMAWDLKSGWSELLLSDIKNTVDSIRYNLLIPDLSRPAKTVYPFDKAGTFSELLPDKLINLAKLNDLGADILDGSNNWVITGSRSKSGKPVLANDMHLGFNVPGIWYQMHQVIPGRLNVSGVVLPGAPAIICGHNDSIAWGMTNVSTDNIEFYEEKVNPQDSSQYEYEGNWVNFIEEKTIIAISGEESVERTLKFSHRGPVVSGFKKITGNVLTMHWAGDERSNELNTVLSLNTANNWTEFKEALRTFTSLSQNIAYADKSGNIGLFCAAGIPIRNRDIPIGVLPGHSSEYDWKGFVPFEELPFSYNPPDGYVASANNRTVTPDYSYHIGTWYSLPHRFIRITEMLSEGDLLGPEDFMKIQLDQHSSMAKEYLPLLIAAIEKHGDLAANEQKVFEILKKWDYSMEAESAAASIFETMYLRFMECTFGDDLGNELFNSFNGTTSISRNATDRLFKEEISPWFDDVNTPGVTESFTDIAYCAFTTAIAELTEKMGSDPDAWEWGNIHRLVLAHPLSAVGLIEKAFDLNPDPIPVGGSFHTVSPYSYSSNKPFDSNHGASHRHIYDLSDWDKAKTIIPTGISGVPASRHYCDQTNLYVNGKYHSDFFSMEKVTANALYRMKFEPK
jgi:penicillin amidase